MSMLDNKNHYDRTQNQPDEQSWALRLWIVIRHSAVDVDDDDDDDNDVFDQEPLYG